MSRRVFFRQLLCMGGHCGPYTTREVATFHIESWLPLPINASYEPQESPDPVESPEE